MLLRNAGAARWCAEHDGGVPVHKLGKFRSISRKMRSVKNRRSALFPQSQFQGEYQMKSPNQRLILAVCAVSIAEVAMAAIPKASVDRDPKDARTAIVVATSPEGDNATYACQFAWRISFTGGVETTDHCEVNIPPDSKNLAICTKRYDKRISLVSMVGTQCKPAVP